MKLQQIILFTLLLSMLVLSACVTGQAKGGKTIETLTPECGDRIDNDGDGYCDYTGSTRRCLDGSIPGDVDCFSINDNSEAGLSLECDVIVRECSVQEDCPSSIETSCRDNTLYTTTYSSSCVKTECGKVCEKGRPITTKTICENGCENGACIIKETPSCTDSDGGQDYETQGTITYEGFIANTTSTDYCVDNGTVREFYCQDGRPASVEYTCEGMCVDGACVEDTTGSENPSEDCRYDIVYIPNQVDVALSYSGTSHTWDETINFYYQLNNNVGWQPICSIAALPSSYYGPTCQQIEYNGETVNTCVLGVEPNEISNEECLSLWLSTYEDYLNLANQNSLDYEGASYDESMMEPGSTYFEYQDLFCEENNTNQTNETNNTVECNRDVVYKPGQIENMFAGWGEFIKDSTNTVAFYYLYNYNNYNDYAVNFCQIKTLPIQYEFNDNCYGGYYYDGQEIVVCSSSWTGQETDSQKCYSLFEETYYQDYIDLTQQEQDSLEYRQAIYDASMFILGSQYLTWEQYFCNQ